MSCKTHSENPSSSLASRSAPSANEPWRATHLHTKSQRPYRVTGERLNVQDDIAVSGYDYEDSNGNKFWQSKERFDEILANGSPRFERINIDDAT